MLFLEEMLCRSCFSGVGVPGKIVSLIRILYNGIKIVVPLILIIIGMIDMAKAVTGKDENEIKKAQNLLVKRAIAAALVFLIFSLVTLLASALGEKGAMKCANCLLNSEDSDESYYQEQDCIKQGGKWINICTFVNDEGLQQYRYLNEKGCKDMAHGESYTYEKGCWSELG